jgi:hypothetical protein
MRRITYRSSLWIVAAVVCLLRIPVQAGIARSDEARVVAANWLRFIVERDGAWGETPNPMLTVAKEFRRGGLLLGYYFAAKPQGYIIVSALKEMAPIKAYSTTSTMDPDDEEGMCALLKDVLERRTRQLLMGLGGLDSARLQGLQGRRVDAHRKVWSILLAGGSALKTNLLSLSPQPAGPVGPFLETGWHQRWPYNKLAPSGSGCSNTYAGCVAVAMAQVMRYYYWPPYGTGSHSYDWDNDDSCPDQSVDGHELSADFSDSYDWVHMPAGATSTTREEDAVAELCYEAGVAVDMDYGCCSSGAYMTDVRDALVDDFQYMQTAKYETRGDQFDDAFWESYVFEELGKRRPLIYKIKGSGDFNHLIVLDGYDVTGGERLVHANYGWNDAHTAWYSLDYLDCDSSPGLQGGCDPDEEMMIRLLYPKNAVWGSPPALIWKEGYHYIFGDLTTSDITIEAGSLVQFFGGTTGTRITCSGDSIDFSGSVSKPIQFFSHGDLSKGMKLTGGGVKILPAGSITMH